MLDSLFCQPITWWIIIHFSSTAQHVFALSRSLVCQTFTHDILLWIGHVPQRSIDWSGEEFTLEIKPQGLTTLEFSPDGETLASCSGPAVSFWNPMTGAWCGYVTRSEFGVMSMAYFLDGQFLAYLSHDDRRRR
jgi:WD40 repeat protein